VAEERISQTASARDLGPGQAEARDKSQYYALKGVLTNFASNPAVNGKTVRTFLEKSPRQFFALSLQLLKEGGLSQTGRTYLVGLLADRQVMVHALCRADTLSCEEAIELATHLQKTYPTIDSQLIRYALEGITEHSPDEEWARLERALAVVAHLTASQRLIPTLMALLRDEDARLRSRAAPHVIRAIRNPAWLRELVKDDDPRVRSNAVETFLALTPMPEEMELIEQLVTDVHHRVASTATMVVYFHADRARAEAVLDGFAKHHDPAFRAAAAWAMGLTRNASYLSVLQQMIREENGEIKRAALQSCVSLRREHAGSPVPA
jgi:HEAT repeat protein